MNRRNMEERYMSAQSVLRRPKAAFAEWRQHVRLAIPLGFELAKRDIKAQYRQTLLGYIWAILPALGTAIAFTMMKSANILQTGDTAIPYPVYVFIGTLFWQLFSTSVSKPVEVVHTNVRVLALMRFPRESLLIAAMLLVLFDTFIKLCLLPILFMSFGAWPDQDIIYLPFVLLAFILFGNAIGVLLSPLNLIFHDVRIVIPVIMAVLVLVSPVGYVVPESGWLKMVIDYNPLTNMLAAARGALSAMPMPALSSWALTGLISAVLLVFAVVFYLVSLPIVIERHSE